VIQVMLCLCCVQVAHVIQVMLCLCCVCRLLSHMIQVMLHMIQVTLSYLLMLVFMTYNVWLCLSVVVGAGLGYAIFGRLKSTVIDSNEHCN